MERVELDGRKTKGRRKIEIKLIEKEIDRLLTFTKRRKGIYKKGSELATLSGSEVGMVFFSATGKPFSFGHPSVEAVLERYINYIHPKQPLNDGGAVQPVVEDHQRKTTEELSEQLDATSSQLEAEKKRGKELRELIKASRAANPTGDVGWWEAKIDELSTEQLDAISIPMEAFLNDVVKHFNELGNH